jgi:hypothetical protein
MGWLEPPPYHFTSLNSIQKISLGNTENGGVAKPYAFKVIKYQERTLDVLQQEK